MYVVLMRSGGYVTRTRKRLRFCKSFNVNVNLDRVMFSCPFLLFDNVKIRSNANDS
jgi:hypothetical protein